MSKLKAVLLDYDGTLRDSSQLIYEALEHTFTSHGLPMPSRQQLKPLIHHHSNIHREFASHLTFEEFDAPYMRKVVELLPEVRLYEGVEKALQRLHERGYKLALVTAANSAAEQVKKQGIGHYFDTIVSGKDIINHKPDPEGILLALKRLDVAAEDAIMVGDLPTDLQAGQAAGLRATIGITYGMGSREALTASGANQVIDSMDQLISAIVAIERA